MKLWAISSRTVIRLLAIWVLAGSLTQANAQFIDSIYWRPADPVAGDEVVLDFIAYFGRLGYEWETSVNIEDHAITVDWYLDEMDVMMQMAGPWWGFTDLGALEAGEYNITLRLFLLYNGEEDYEMTDEAQTQMVVSNQALTLVTGWNFISAQFLPDDDDVESIFAELVERGSLYCVKNQEGSFYLPGRWPGLEHWDSRQGYMVNMYREDVLHILGERIAADEPISLEAGWNMVAYLPEGNLSAPEAFQGIEDVILIAKNGAGGFYVPSLHFNNMGSLQPGQGYLLRVSEAVDFIWNEP